jgi:hypothetical protein
MSQQLINHSPDLLRLRDEGYDLKIKSGFLLIGSIPYLNHEKIVKRGTLISAFTQQGDKVAKPPDHVVYFAGEFPCNSDGTLILQIQHSSVEQELAQGVKSNHMFSARPTNEFKDYYEKMTNYVNIMLSQVSLLDSSATPCVFPSVATEENESVFKYYDTASSIYGISHLAEKLQDQFIGIIGLGGTGSYILDLVAKTPVKEIHLYDGDDFFIHNAFRAPGAPSCDDLNAGLKKVTYFQRIYSNMHRNITSHAVYLDDENIIDISAMNFVFICIDKSEIKKMIIDKLIELHIPFIDTGLGVTKQSDMLSALIRITTCTSEYSDHHRSRIPLTDFQQIGVYESDIQIAELNSLCAALAIIKWKKICGYYYDDTHEHSSVYCLNGNALVNEDKSE